MKIRIKSPKGQTNNHGEENLYDWAVPLASTLLIFEFTFTYSYPNAECTFDIQGAESKIEELLLTEFVDLRWDNVKEAG